MFVCNAKHLGSEKLAVLQDAWEQCRGEWKKSELYLKISNKRRHKTHGARLWLTKSQISQKYNSDAMAESICDSKRRDPELFTRIPPTSRPRVGGWGGFGKHAEPIIPMPRLLYISFIKSNIKSNLVDDYDVNYENVN